MCYLELMKMEYFGVKSADLVVVASLVIGALVILVGFIAGRRTGSARTKFAHVNPAGYPTPPPPPPTHIQRPHHEAFGNIPISSAPGKRNKNKKRRDTTQAFAHPWMVGALKGHTAPVRDMNFSSDGKFLATTAEDRTVHLWCTKDLANKERKSLRINIEYDSGTRVCVSPDGKSFLIHKALGNNIEVYGLKKKSNGFFTSAQPVKQFPKEHEEDVVGMDIACNGNFIMTCSDKNDLIIWDLKGEILASIKTHLDPTYRARISPCGRFVAASGFTPDVKVWEVEFSKTGEFKGVNTAFNLAGHASGIYDFNFCADSSRMVSVCKDGKYRIFDTEIEFKKGEDAHLLVSGSWENTTPTSVALSPNGEVVAISHGKSLSFFSAITGQLDATIEDLGFVSCLIFDASGEYLLAAVDRQIKIFRNITGYRVAIESAKRKLQQRQTAATQERLKATIADATAFLQSMGEPITI